MLKLKYLLLLYIIFCNATVFAANADFLDTPRSIRIGLDMFGKHSKLEFNSPNGTINIYKGQKKELLFAGKASKLSVAVKEDGSISLTVNNQTFKSNENVIVSNGIGQKSDNSLLTISSASKKTTYRGHIELQLRNGKLFLVNLVDMEQYLRSVVPSEISTRAPSSSQEAQTIAARTYAIRNIDRHLKRDDFNLCDTVHCQAYFGVSKEAKLSDEAIRATEGKILVFDDQPANTVYHSNCGGYIISSQTAWNGNDVPYLVGHYDGIKGQKSFCEYGKDFLSRKANLTLPEKSKRLVIGITAYKSKKKTHNNFGHRVGMCQDGAIGMALIGYSCSNILGFYYPKTKIETLKYASNNKSNKFAPTEVSTLAELKAMAEKRKLQKPLLPKEITNSENQISKTEPVETAVNTINTTSKDGSSDEDAITLSNPPIQPSSIEDLNNNVTNIEIINERLNKIKDVLKEVSITKPNSTSLAVKKLFWSPGNIKSSNTSKLSRR